MGKFLTWLKFLKGNGYRESGGKEDWVLESTVKVISSVKVCGVKGICI